MAKKVGKIIITAVGYAIPVIFSTALIVGTYIANSYSDVVTAYLGQSNQKIIPAENEEKIAYTSEFASTADKRKEEEKINLQIEEEGIVLLKNENSCLPLITNISNKAKVSLFGVGSRDFIYGGTGSGSVDTSIAPTLKSALEASGYEINETLVNFYVNGRGKNYKNETMDISGTSGQYKVNECPANMFTNSVKNSFAEYKDAAIITINRAGSESSDLPFVSINDGSRHYLELTADEESLFELVGQSDFSKRILLVNTATPMELGFIDKAEYKLDAVLWVGQVGQNGMYGIGNILNGSVNPSGHLVDTYPYNSLGNPATINQGSFQITNSDYSKANKYMVYAEGIYVGYRYYETRYEDVVLNSGNANNSIGSVDEANWDYVKEVQFPFGYGLSYTSFDYSNFKVEEKENEYVLSVDVKNSGALKGKDAVEFYMQSPFTDYDKANDIEKPAIELVAFSKTKELEANESQTVSATVQKEALRVYDSKIAKSYYVDNGDYYFATGHNVHDALNNILASKGQSAKADKVGQEALTKKVTVTIDNNKFVKTANGYQINNQFDDADIRTYDSSFKYLSRKDWKSTFPVVYENGSFEASAELLKYCVAPKAGVTYVDKDDSVAKPEANKQNGLTLASLRGLEHDNEAWEDLLDEMSYSDLQTLVRLGGYKTQAISSIAVPEELNLDGPAGIQSIAGIQVNLTDQPFSWCSEVVIASTWNVELAKRMGELVGEDALANSQGEVRIAGWYAPAMNTHRSAFSGRNFEYYSEDGLLAGKMGANKVKGATDKGLITYIKHFALNDQETNRAGVCIFANEQSIREIYLEPFEYSVREGGALGVMVAMNRVGTRWAGAHKGLMTETLRNEWGFKGVAVTDQASYASFYYADIREGLAAGTDMWLNTNNTLWLEQLGDYENNPLLLTQLRTACKHILYAVGNSAAMNGMSASTRIVKITPAWKNWLVGAHIGVHALSLLGIILTTLYLFNIKLFRRKK